MLLPPSTVPFDDAAAEFIEQISQRLKAGESIDAQQLIAEHPQHREHIDEFLPILHEMHRAGAPSADEAAASVGTHGRLGDFRIIREIGRGGMGVVYEAEQISLNRRIALKVLPFAAAVNSRRLARFRIEARAAAGLHHDHIVPVFSIGCERSLHYYAMQLIEGCTLVDFVAEARSLGLGGDAVSVDSPATTTPTVTAGGRYRSNTVERLRIVARLGVQAANALQHAHDHGVVHRDIKPANLLIDADGKLWITDFGLAMMQNGGGVTATGDLAGTLRYMSPEQIRSDRTVLDERTDVYSLGVTLYETLTGEAAFAGESYEQLLREICEKEPVRPRQRNQKIPVALETIVLKAMRKAAHDRYRSAGEMADDLQRFLAGQPIHARSPTLAERAASWVRRHKAIVVAAFCALLIVAIVTSISTVLVGQAYQSEVILREHLELEKSRAADNLDLAQVNLQAALAGLSEILDTLVARYREPKTPITPEDREVLEKLFATYKAFGLMSSQSPAIRRLLLYARSRMAGIHLATGDVQSAVHEFELIKQHLFCKWRISEVGHLGFHVQVSTFGFPVVTDLGEDG